MKFRKNLALLIAAALSTSCMVGCGSSSSTGGTKSGDKTLTVLTHRTDMEEKFKEYAAEFEKGHEGVKINFECVNDYQNNLSTRMGTDDYGDVLMIPANITKNDYPDFFEPIGTSDELADKYDCIDNAIYEGKVYGLPTGINAIGFVYNSKVFEDAGITSLPKSADEYINDLKLIKEKCPGVVPYYTNYHDAWTLTNFTNTIEIPMAGDPDYMNKLIYNKNEFLPGSATYDSLKLLYEPVAQKLVEDDPMTTDWEKSKQDMADGKIGVMCLGSWAVGQIKDKSKTPENIKFMAVPAVHNGKQTIQISSDYLMGINKNCKNIDLAKEFVKFFVETYPKDSNMICSIKGTKYPDFLKVDDSTELVQATPGTDQSTKDMDAVQKESLINLTDPNWVKPIVEIGLGNGTQTFDEYMKSLNESWVKGINSLGN